MDWYLYMLRTAAGSLYTGITTEPQRRLLEHESGSGARSLRGRGPLQLVFTAPFPDRASASRAEYQVKRLSRSAKEQLLAGDISLKSILIPGPASGAETCTESPQRQIVIRTARLDLVVMEEQDCEPLLHLYADPQTLLYFPQTYDATWVRDLISRQRSLFASQGTGLLTLILRANGDVLGDCGILPRDLDGSPELEVAYHLQRCHWGRGYATEAARACMDYAFGCLGAKRVISMIRPENLPSCRVAERNGMSAIGECLHAGLRHLVYSGYDGLGDGSRQERR